MLFVINKNLEFLKYEYRTRNAILSSVGKIAASNSTTI